MCGCIYIQMCKLKNVQIKMHSLLIRDSPPWFVAHETPSQWFDAHETLHALLKNADVKISKCAN